MASFEYGGDLTVAYEVSDCGRAIEWYTDVLGFKLLYHLEEMGWCEMGTPVKGVNVGFSQVERPKVGAGPTLTWAVKDIDAARAELEGKGVRFDGETRTIPGLVRLAVFFDPDGNDLMFSQSLGKC
jgi:predicted enzyme related to lactoylglutathione lyase